MVDPPSGLRALIVIDDVTLGPAAGGVRTRRYGDVREAFNDCAALARAMTLKCSIAGVDAGGGKAVVLDHDGLDREAAFEKLGELIEELGGLFRTAGDLGTTPSDVEAMARTTRFVHTEGGLSDAVARGLVRCVAACTDVRGRTGGLADLRVAVQGCGTVGSAVARALSRAGAQLWVADVDAARARALADELDASMCLPDAVFDAEVDVVAPCAVGGVITREVAERLRAWAICGGANNAIASRAAAAALSARDILHVPDVIASAGAVIEGIGRSVMNLEDRTLLIDQLGDTARAVLDEARSTGRPAEDVAAERARARIDAARADRDQITST